MFVSFNNSSFMKFKSLLETFRLLILMYFYSHYFFASCTVHISVMFVPFFTLSQVMATPPMLAALTLIFASNLYVSDEDKYLMI